MSEAKELKGETSGASVTDSEIPVMTYPVTEMNIQVLGNMTASAAKRTFTEATMTRRSAETAGEMDDGTDI